MGCRCTLVIKNVQVTQIQQDVMWCVRPEDLSNHSISHRGLHIPVLRVALVCSINRLDKRGVRNQEPALFFVWDWNGPCLSAHAFHEASLHDAGHIALLQGLVGFAVQGVSGKCLSPMHVQKGKPCIIHQQEPITEEACLELFALQIWVTGLYAHLRLWPSRRRGMP